MQTSIPINPDQIHEAAGEGDIPKIIKLFIEDPSCLNRPDSKYGSYPVDFAAQRGHLKTLIWLVEQGAILQTPKITRFAFQSQNIEIVNYLEEQHILIPPMHLAFCKGDLNSIKILLEQGRDIFEIDKHGFMPIDCAISFGKKKVIYYLLSDYPIHLNTQTTQENQPSKGMTIAFILALHKRWDWLKEFAIVDKNLLNLNVCTSDNLTLSHLLAFDNQWDLFKEFLFRAESPVNPNLAVSTGTNRGFTLAYGLVLSRQWELLEMFKDQPIDINAGPSAEDHPDLGCTFAYFMAAEGKWDLLENFIERHQGFIDLNAGPSAANHIFKGVTLAHGIGASGKFRLLEKAAKKANDINLNAAPASVYHLMRGYSLSLMLARAKEFRLLEDLTEKTDFVDLNPAIYAENHPMRGFSLIVALLMANVRGDLLRKLVLKSKVVNLNVIFTTLKDNLKTTLIRCITASKQWDLLHAFVANGSKVEPAFLDYFEDDLFSSEAAGVPPQFHGQDILIKLGVLIINNDSEIEECLQSLYAAKYHPAYMEINVLLHPINLASSLRRFDILFLILKTFPLKENILPPQSMIQEMINCACDSGSKEILKLMISYVGINPEIQNLAIIRAAENIKLHDDENNPRLQDFIELLEFLVYGLGGSYERNLDVIPHKSVQTLIKISQNKSEICHSKILFDRYGTFFKAAIPSSLWTNIDQKDRTEGLENSGILLTLLPSLTRDVIEKIHYMLFLILLETETACDDENKIGFRFS